MSTTTWMSVMQNYKTNTSRGRESSSVERKGGMVLVKNELGVTLIEILTVVAMIGILSSVAIPSFNVWLYKYRADAEVNRLYFNMMAAKQRAIRNNSTVIFTFNAANNTYSIHDDLDEDGTVDLNETNATIPFENEMTYGITPGILGVWGAAVSNVISLGGNNSISFLSAGRANRSGAIYLIPASDLATGNRGNQRAVKIIQATGSVEIMKYDGAGSPGPWS